jgi:hypothetical protein
MKLPTIFHFCEITMPSAEQLGLNPAVSPAKSTI